MATDTASPRARTPDDAPTPWWKRWWVILLAFPAVALAIGGLLLFFFLFASIPLPEDVGASPTVVLDAAGNEFGTLNPQAARQDVAIDSLPEHVPAAVMSAEDRRFNEHRGISPAGIVRALFANAKAGGVTQGGSTITQQYVKNALVGNDRTFLRKAKEASLAIKLEQRFDKPKILEMYLNTIYWGRGAYGVEAAAQTYFGKPAADLTVNEAATLAGIIQQPENLDPSENPAGARNRRDYVVNGMAEEGWLDAASAQELLTADVPETTERQTVEFGEGAYYLDAVKRELSRVLGDAEVYTGLTVHTELDRDFQLAAESTLQSALDGQPYTGAVVSIDPRSGGVRALVGGPDFAVQQYNTAVRSARQVGSSFKPFTLTAFVEAGYSPLSRFEAPASITVPSGNGETQVQNYDREDHGIEDLYEATRRSTNTVYIQVQDEVGSEAVQDTAGRLGLPRERTDRDGETTSTMPSEASLTLGVGSFTPMEMASAYATLAAGGVRTTPHLVTEVVDRGGEVIYAADVEQNAVVKANDAYIVTDVLRGVVEDGTGTAAQIGRPAAGKTGTTNDYTDAWFTGYVPQLATAVWIGNLDNSPMEGEITGGSVPARIWGSYMATALEKVEVEDFPEPDLGGKDELNGRPEPTESPSPTEEDACPPTDGGEDGADRVVDQALGSGEDEQPDCPEPSDSPSPTADPSASPSTSPSPTARPSASASPDEEPSATPEPTSEPTTEPTSEPTSEPTPTQEPTSEPSPTLSPQSSGGDGDGSTSTATSNEPSPEPSPTG